MVGAEIDLVLGEDHPLGHLAAQLAALEREPVRERRARQRDRDLRPGAEVPGAADDLVRLGLPHVDLAELQPVGVRMLLRLEHVADAEEAEIAAVSATPSRMTSLTSAVEIESAVGDLRCRRVDAHVLAQPARAEPSRQNCLRKRRSFSQNGRMPGMPMRSCAVRSMPIPNAKPVYSSGSQPTNS